jgi:hypothetical protein
MKNIYILYETYDVDDLWPYAFSEQLPKVTDAFKHTWFPRFTTNAAPDAELVLVSTTISDEDYELLSDAFNSVSDPCDLYLEDSLKTVLENIDESRYQPGTSTKELLILPGEDTREEFITWFAKKLKMSPDDVEDWIDPDSTKWLNAAAEYAATII